MSLNISLTHNYNVFFLTAWRRRNLIAQSQSGTGKTATFVAAMLSHTDLDKNYPHVICVSPTYELAIQTKEVLEKMAKFLPQDLIFTFSHYNIRIFVINSWSFLAIAHRLPPLSSMKIALFSHNKKKLYSLLLMGEQRISHEVWRAVKKKIY